ncbi:MAG: DUF58 domain-containing protein [Candidatus Coatesbacteria bacterium]
MATPAAAPFAPETLRNIRRLEIKTRRLVNELFGGRYHSSFKGRGMTFADIREYAPGDEIRSIDWNVTARMGTPFIKQYTEERELTICLVVDNSASLKFGTRVRSKHSLAVELAAVLAFAALRNNDKVGLLLFSDAVDRYVRPRKSRLHALRILRDMLVLEPKGNGTGLAEALAFLNRVQRKRAVVFLFSDFLAAGWEQPLAVTQRRHDTIAFVLEDPRERDLPAAGWLNLEDLETGERVLVDTGNASVRERLARSRADARKHRDGIFRKLGLDTIPLETGQPYLKPLMAFFERRARRLR